MSSNNITTSKTEKETWINFSDSQIFYLQDLLLTEISRLRIKTHTINNDTDYVARINNHIDFLRETLVNINAHVVNQQFILGHLYTELELAHNNENDRYE